MTIDQLAAYLNSLFNDDAVFEGWRDEYIANRLTIIDGEVSFRNLAQKLVEDGHIKLNPDSSTP